MVYRCKQTRESSLGFHSYSVAMITVLAHYIPTKETTHRFSNFYAYYITAFNLFLVEGLKLMSKQLCLLFVLGHKDVVV